MCRLLCVLDFDETQRKAVREAGRLAGLNILRTINEPVASAIAYELDKHRKEQNIIVFDLGEGASA